MKMKITIQIMGILGFILICMGIIQNNLIMVIGGGFIGISDALYFIGNEIAKKEAQRKGDLK